mgnify:FL=1
MSLLSASLHPEKIVVNSVELIGKLKVIRDKTSALSGSDKDDVAWDLDDLIDELENLHLDTHGCRAITNSEGKDEL